MRDMPTTHIHTLDDWELVRLCRRHSKRYFNELIRRHYALVANICYRYLLDPELTREVTQDIFLKVYLSLDMVKKKGPPFHHWLCRVATNYCKNIYRRKKRENEILQEGKVDFWYENAIFKQPPDWEYGRSVAVKQVNTALAQVKIEERIPLVLREVGDFSIEEIAKITGSPKYTVRRRIKRARQKVQKILSQQSVIKNASSGFIAMPKVNVG
jgi:RNA polymerase sigma-70 factor (ECF subfamily)